MALNLTEAITKLVDEMKFLGVWAGISEKRFDQIKELITRDDITVDELDSLWQHLSKLKRNQWKALYDIRYAMHVTEQMWATYSKMHDAHLITEVKIYRKAANEFRKAFRWVKPKESEPNPQQSETRPE